MTGSEFFYRKTAAASSGGGLGLLIALYDTLAGDLRRMIEAERGNDLVRRCREANHALLVIGYLEECVTRGNSGDLADQLTAFYASLRRKLIVAQARRSPAIIEEQMAEILKIREAWQAMEMKTQPAAPEILRPTSAEKFAGDEAEPPGRLSWSA